MKTTKEIKELLNNIPGSNNGYNLVTVDKFMWGKGKNNEIVFGFISINKKITPLIQTTSHLKLYINNLFEIKIEGEESWIIVRELYGGLVKLHSVTDQKTILEILE